MRLLFCVYEDVNRAPSAVMFDGTAEQLGWARAGVAKLNERVGWVCAFHEFGFDEPQPRSPSTVGRDTVIVSEWFEEGRCRNHPMTNEPVLPPKCFTALCRAAYEGEVMNAFAWLFRSRGWEGEMTSERLFAPNGG